LENSHDFGVLAKTPIETPTNCHWAMDYFRRPFFVRNFANENKEIIQLENNRLWKEK